MDFIPNSPKQKKEMLKEIGFNSINELFKDIPEQIRIKGDIKLGEGLSEIELKKEITAMSRKNASSCSYTYFLGAGCYSHFIPSIVPHLVGRSEFYTAYTPYQPEASQGMLQSIYEWQSAISILTGMDLANASMYDGASALAETTLMARCIRRRNEIIISKAVHPHYRQTVETYANAAGLKLKTANPELGATSLKELKKGISENTAAVLIQSPNFFGCIEDLEEIAALAHEKGALLVVCINELVSLGIMKPPAEFGADIVCGEAQSFGNHMSFGGPHVGFISTRTEYVRAIPGRLVGKTSDAEGKEGFILTLQAREQHIRREKATSNICSNEALCALAALIHIMALGKRGMLELAQQNMQLAHYAYRKLLKIRDIEAVFETPFFNEFVLKFHDAEKVQKRLLENNIIAGYNLSRDYPELENCLLFCVTEMNSVDDINRVAKIVGEEK